MDKVISLFPQIYVTSIIKLVVLAVIMDTCFGFMRAVKEHKFNSNFEIDGAVRKISMLASLVFLIIFDRIAQLNLIGFVPGDIRTYLSFNRIGAAEFFGLLYLSYETISILKNMTLCGLPVKRIWEVIKKFLSKYTDELPDNV